MKLLTATYYDKVEAAVVVNDDEAEAGLAAMQAANKFPAEITVQILSAVSLEDAIAYLADFE